MVHKEARFRRSIKLNFEEVAFVEKKINRSESCIL